MGAVGGVGADSNQILMPCHMTEAWKKEDLSSESVCKNTSPNENICLCSGATLASKPQSGSNLSHHHPHQQTLTPPLCSLRPPPFLRLGHSYGMFFGLCFLRGHICRGTCVCSCVRICTGMYACVFDCV